MGGGFKPPMGGPPPPMGGMGGGFKPPMGAPPPPRAPNPPPPAQQKCVAIYDFTAQQDGDLNIHVNDTITVLSQEGAWWKGELHGQVGQFPSNYVRLL